MIARVKTQWIEEFFIPLESSWNLDVWNGLAWPIWNLKHKLWQKEGPGVKFDSWSLKVRNRPTFLACKWLATYRWKAFNKGYNFALDPISIKGLHAKLWAPKVVGVLILGILGLPLRSPKTKCHFNVALVVATPLWPSVGVKPNTPKVGDLESSGTPECLEFHNKAQNYSYWGVLGVIGKVLKRRYRKWPRIGHLDICSPSYGQKKGRESNWQFDSRPLKFGNRPLPDIRFESATRRWKDLDEGYNFGSDLVAIRLCSRELWAPKVPGFQPGQFRDSNLESREKEPFGCSLGGEL